MSVLQRVVVVILFGLFALMLARLVFIDTAQPRQTSGTFSDLYEPSGLVYIGEGQFILIEDEADSPFHLLRLKQTGGLQRIAEIRQAGNQRRLNDLEGIAFDGEFVYAITSHSLTKKGKEGKDRAILIRYRYRDDALEDAGEVTDLKLWLIKLLKERYPQYSKNKLRKQLNIEALSWSPETKKLYIGLRAPVIEGMSLIIKIENPSAIFDRNSAQGMNAAVIPLNLGGVGIRAMSRDREQASLLLVAGDKKKGSGEFSLWRWNEPESAPPQRIQTVQSATEGVASFMLPGMAGSVLLQDDGKRKKSEPAHYRVQFLE